MNRTELFVNLKRVEPNDVFYSWIEEILHSTRLYVLVNGKSIGFFKCTRGVRQGDPLSPLLFCIAEDVLSHSISKALQDGELQPMVLCRNVQIPTHVLYADDIMVFCKGSKKHVCCLLHLFNSYGAISGQVINKQKSTFYSGAIPNSRLVMITNLLGFSVGTIPFTYLGYPIFVGKPKVIHFQSLVDKIKFKLASWKGAMLSIMGRVQLVKSIIHGMLVYSFHIYAWPRNLLKKLDMWIRNFIWRGDVGMRIICTVTWKRVCCSHEEGGLDTWSLVKINDSLLLHRCWKLFSSSDQWTLLCQSRYLTFGRPAHYYLRSSVWIGIKQHVSTVRKNSRWLIGMGVDVLFWLDTCLDKSLVELFNFPASAYPSLTAKVSSFIFNHKWKLPVSIVQQDASLASQIHLTTLPQLPIEDRLVWYSTTGGSLSVKQEFTHLFPTQQLVPWAQWLWHNFIPPSSPFVAWICFHNKMSTDENLIKRGYVVVSGCALCLSSKETTQLDIFFFIVTLPNTCGIGWVPCLMLCSTVAALRPFFIVYMQVEVEGLDPIKCKSIQCRLLYHQRYKSEVMDIPDTSI
ncbi:hypothetical protein TSUD_180290 [Trifolium subterraneum]|uniref:Reverse transcriptase domain-containing protein n=1 Tax=Trifolium subterraneum TaxID=3900 RepID=A0A2Z6PSR4_TRISU|nr:hypothetical protein TSUD_180290 [Trifolium subterraneum]